VFEFVKLEETLVRIKLFEYDDYPGIILLNELTRQKRVNSLLKLCPIGQVGVGEVLSTEERAGEICVFVSIKNLSKDDQTKYLDYYYKSKKLCNFMKRIAVNTKRSLLETCEYLSWPMYDMIAASENIDEHPLDRIDHPDKIKKVIQDKVGKETEKEDKVELEEKLEESDEDLVTNTNATQNTTNEDPFETEGTGGTDGKKGTEGTEGNEEDITGDNFKLSKDMAELLLESHEQFFGKLMMTKTIRVGLICYGIDGMKIIRETLIKLRDNFNSDEKKPNFDLRSDQMGNFSRDEKKPKVSLTFNLRDIPVYEFKLKSLNTEELDLAHDYLLNNLKDDRLLFRHISTK
jgi:translation initiation factor 2 alpha subunit (eIF-2alpha)